ncbi:MAG: hypothetical protein HXS52_04985 [Theionarchaea archaeon]|nr:hypothetical protein [Theionarchaea archaeon]MBU7037262.1 hypothetical protein [Theionarchaea archaeon]
MNWDNLLEEVKKKAREGDHRCLQFLELFEDLPLGLKERAMKCAIEINVYYGRHGKISEQKILEIAERWRVREVLEDEIFVLQLQKFTDLGKEPAGGELA